MTDLLRVDGIEAAYGKVTALKDVSIAIRPGEIVAILGANGAGKTTLLNAISGVLPVTAGEIRFDGAPINGRKPWQTSRLGISHVPEGREIFPDMTVEANLNIVDSNGGGPAFTVPDILEMFPRLQERISQLAGGLSGGEQQMLAIGRGLMARPRLILFDEPSLGLSPVLTKFVLSSIAGLRAKGIATLLVEQNMRAALRIADRAYVLRVGRIVRAGTAAEIANSPDIQEAYLGV
ncbi:MULTISPECIES: ABC transporter ATP-binding protein [Bradyrhizobium]|jgi:branched-chain amino acid transport system ATP-binding protein|uniref:Branched-chain amino acid transport system ATP-binding protein n=2 Tax=Bradyrhizobium TaxID=374 RepID=A0ABY0PTH7_9BRAD|nr:MULTISPECIES: ABC transporter ATP-binding protein [Bradyrhizobium]SDI92490.1 branched-chain amino acid transport system ATP-binding protein [Bradyrhizobium ottawaense]SED08116.1 branched-chain amino acid transport system ATP-binding protein [Bradyrhizobium lablabi]SHL14431.1 branched-chain amino acid transport system ATP-binding protein [Bradyrhizobium lablabi]